MKIWLIVILLLLVAIVIGQNSEVVTVKLLFWDLTVSRVIVFLLTLIAGFVTGFATAKLPRRAGSGK